MSETPHRHPILAPEEGESLDDFLRRAADVHQWPQATLDEDLVVIRGMLTAFADPREAAAYGSYILRALSFAAHSSMALRHLDRYLRATGNGGREDRLAALRDNPEHLHFLCSFFAFSAYLSEIVINHPEYLSWIFRQSKLNREKSLERYRQQVAEWMTPHDDYEARRAALTLFKKRELLRIGVREIRELGSTQELCRELSNLAQAIIEIAYEDCYARLMDRHGLPISEASDEPSGYCIYAMGKFGAGELNFSSDVDLIFVYEDEGTTEGIAEGLRGEMVRRLSNHDFFCKLSHEISGYLSYANAEGFLFRVDNRLRPEGNAGPLARSRSAYAAYLGSQAGLWEKVAYIKARFLVGDASLAARFDKIIEQFVYNNNIPSELFPEIARLKHRIDYERLDAEGRELDIKRGRGGIREIEFIVAGHQLVLGADRPGMRVRGTLDTLKLLSVAGPIDRETAQTLERAYLLFRRIEHTLQMMAEQQTHRMPSAENERERLSIRCGFLTVALFEQTLDEYRRFVRGRFDEMFSMQERADGFSLVNSLLTADTPPPQALRELEKTGLGDVEGFRALQKLAIGTGEYAPSARGQAGFQRLLPMLLDELPFVALPHEAVRQFDLLLRAARGFAWVYELCLSHPPILKLLLRTLGFGSLLARQLIAHPEWLDEVFHGHGFSRTRIDESSALLARDIATLAPEDAIVRLRQFKQIETFLVSTQEVLATRPSSEAAAKISHLAEVSLQGACDICTRIVTGCERAADFPVRWAIIGLGGLGDRQVHANGDLDVALAFEDGDDWHGESPGTWIDRIGRQLITMFGAITPEGQLWKIDARLRPEGRNGPLAASRSRFLSYYREEAGLWEWQVLTKARPVAGDLRFGASVLADLYVLLGETVPPADMASEVYTMRRRIEDNVRLPRNAIVDIKSGSGGVVAMEFLVQYLQLRHYREASTLFPLTTEGALDEFCSRGVLAPDTAEALRRHLMLLRLLQRHHRLLWETTRDFFPAEKSRQEALRRGVNDQLLLQGLAWPDSIQTEMAKAASLYEEFFGRELAAT